MWLFGRNGCRPPSMRCGPGQAVGLRIVLAPNVGDGEIQGARQLPADPVQGIKARAATVVLTCHLPDYHLGVGIDMQLPGLQGHGTLQSLEQRQVLSDIVVLSPDPFANRDPAALRSFNHDSNTRRAGISQRSAVNVCNKIKHLAVLHLTTPCLRISPASRCLNGSSCNELKFSCTVEGLWKTRHEFMRY